MRTIRRTADSMMTCADGGLYYREWPLEIPSRQLWRDMLYSEEGQRKRKKKKKMEKKMRIYRPCVCVCSACEGCVQD